MFSFVHTLDMRWRLKPISETFRETGGLDEAALWLTQKAVPLASRSGPPGDQGRKSDLFFEDSSISFGTVQVELGEPSKKNYILS